MSHLITDFPEWRKKACQHCAVGVPVCSEYVRQNAHVNPSIWWNCTAPTHIERIVELEAALGAQVDALYEVGGSEYVYWRRVATDTDPADRAMHDMCIGAMGAAANITAALMGHKPTHHEGRDTAAAVKIVQQFRAFIAQDEGQCESSKKTE